MKKLIYIMSAALLLTACSSDEPVIQCISVVSNNEKAENLIELAENAFEAFYPASSRASKIKTRNVVPIIDNCSRSESPDTLLYIVNMENNAGFVVMSDILSQNPILAVSDKGNILDPDNVDNPGLEFYLNAAREYVSTYSNSDSVIPFRKHVIEYPYAPEKVEPRCTVEWGQQYPQGLYCPNTIAGCVPIATVQALSCFETPSTIQLTYSDKDKDSVDADWKSIKKYTRSCSWSYYNQYIKKDNDSENSLSRAPIGGFTIDFNTPNEKDLGRICRELGKHFNATYNTGSTGVSVSNFLRLPDILQSMNAAINISEYVYDTPTLRGNRNNNPVIVSVAFSYNENTNSTVGHAFLIDGYNFQYEDHYIYEINSNTGEYDILIEHYTVSNDYQHINWGWNGNCNGYFNVGVFKPGEAEIYDNDTNTSNNYNFNIGMYYFILSQKSIIF